MLEEKYDVEYYQDGQFALVHLAEVVLDLIILDIKLLNY